MMMVGYAVGGPLDKIKLVAPITWNGKVLNPDNRPKLLNGRMTPKAYYDGRYAWCSVDDYDTWVWLEVDPLWEILF